MANTFLGYEVASPERQRKTALAVIGVVCLLAVAGMSALFFASREQQSGRELALATITGFETKCRYVVRNISRRATYYDHTGYIDCNRAHEVAAANNSVLGSVQRRTLAVVEFTALDGAKLSSHVELSRKEPVSVGEKVEILYRLDDPYDLREYVQLPLGFGKRSIARQPENELHSNSIDATSKPRPSDAVSNSTRLWVGLATVVVGVLLACWLIKSLYRVIMWLVRAPSASTQPVGPPIRTAVARGGLEKVTSQASEAGFGRRSR